MPLALKCDKPYNIDEARKRKGLPRSKREDSRTTMYELTIRIPDDFQVFFDGKTKFTRRAFVLNRRELQDEVRAFEDEKNEEFIRAKDDYEKSLEAKGKVTQALPLNDMGYCTASLTEFAERYIDGFQTTYDTLNPWGDTSVNAMVKHWPSGGPEEGGRDGHYGYGKYAVYPGDHRRYGLLRGKGR